MNILIVEPFFDRTKQLSQLIVSADCVADHAINAREAEKKIKAGNYDGILISAILPDMTGELFQGLLQGSKILKCPPSFVFHTLEEDKLSVEDYLQTIIRTKEEKPARKEKPEDNKEESQSVSTGSANVNKEKTLPEVPKT